MHTNDNDQLTKPNEVQDEVDDATQIKYFGGHEEYDGIKELDNPLPPWLKYIFYHCCPVNPGVIKFLFVMS